MKSSSHKSLTKRQTEELAKFSLELSKLAIGSWIFGLFTSEFKIQHLILGFGGLTFAILFFKLGLQLFREVK
jgi:hypothetical protein